MKARGFTLLEVLVAISILGLGLTMILSSQAGLFASNQRAQRMTVATSLLRCKMSEVELDLVKNGFSLTDQTDVGECCEDESDAQYSCEWAVETIELPQPASFEEGAPGAPAGSAEGAMGALGDLANAPPGGPAGGLGALGALMGMGPAPGAEPGQTSSMSDLAGAMTSDAPTGGIEAMAMGMVYPSLKPMLEASIRKVTVHVKWSEGSQKRDLTATEYVTNPTTFDPESADKMNDFIDKGGFIQGDTSGNTGKTGSGSPQREKAK